VVTAGSGRNQQALRTVSLIRGVAELIPSDA
jgi:hypothetical protein